MERPITKLTDMLSRIEAVLSPAKPLRDRLSATLHTNMPSLVIGCGCGMVSAWTCYVITRSPHIFAIAIALSTLAIARMGISWWSSREADDRHDGLLVQLFPFANILYAFTAGLLAATLLYNQAPAGAQILGLTYVVAFCALASVRTAGWPLVALGQMAVALMPVFVASLLAWNLPLLVLATLLPCFAVGMATISLNLFRQLTRQIAVADMNLRHAQELRQQARSDVVTGLINRSGFSHAFEPLVASCGQDGKLALLWLDLHRFKVLNDTLGHTAGDTILATIAQRLREVAPPGSIISRFGGDEFLIATRIASRHCAEDLASAVCETVARPLRVNGEMAQTGAYIGVAILPEDAPDAEKLMQAADLALHHAKLDGPNKVRFFDTGMTHALLRRKEIEDELRSAIQKDELSIFFQPIIDLETGRIRTFEALVRWYHPEKGELFPDEFIPVAEDTGLIITLGNWITAQAARTATAWPEDVTLAVNLSPVQIKAPGAALGILSALREARLDPSRLELEVTESLFVEDDQNTTEFMTRLAREGVRFALDDFGTGYSSLHYINRYPFRTIKVDRSFVSGPRTGKRSDAIIRAVAEMGNTLDMDIVAEGLETIEQVQTVRAAGCTLGQGYYFSRAVPDYLAAMLLTHEAKGLAPGRSKGSDRLAG